jgi:hypothetical protein
MPNVADNGTKSGLVSHPGELVFTSALCWKTSPDLNQS